jgi:hypothetical protein
LVPQSPFVIAKRSVSQNVICYLSESQNALTCIYADDSMTE